MDLHPDVDDLLFTERRQWSLPCAVLARSTSSENAQQRAKDAVLAAEPVTEHPSQCRCDDHADLSGSADWIAALETAAASGGSTGRGRSRVVALRRRGSRERYVALAMLGRVGEGVTSRFR